MATETETPLEHIITNCRKDGMVKYLEENPQDFPELINLSISHKQPYAWRAAWLLSNCMTTNDDRVIEHLPTMLKHITNVPDGHKRDLMNVIRKMELSEELESEAFDVSLELWAKISQIPSVRYNAFRLAMTIVAKYPELYEELKTLMTTEYFETLSPGIARSLKKKISAFEKKHTY